MTAALGIIARHPVLAFMVIGLGASFLTAAIRPIAEADVLPYGLPLHGFVGGLLGVGVGAFVVTGALAGRDGVVDLARRSVRWRVPVRWYLVALFTVPVGATLISLAIYGSRALASPPAVGLARSQRSPPSFCCSSCSSSLPKRSDSPGSSNTIGRTAITP